MAKLRRAAIAACTQSGCCRQPQCVSNILQFPTRVGIGLCMSPGFYPGACLCGRGLPQGLVQIADLTDFIWDWFCHQTGIFLAQHACLFECSTAVWKPRGTCYFLLVALFLESLYTYSNLLLYALYRLLNNVLGNMYGTN